MSKVRIDSIIVQIRVYDDEIDDTIPLSEMDEPYKQLITGMMLDNGVCRLTGNIGEFSKERAEIKRKLRAKGIDRIEWRHKNIEHSFKI